MKVRLRNKNSGEYRDIKVGWSWTLFLFAPFLGIPLFMRKLNKWGGVFFILWFVNFFIPTPTEIEILADPNSGVIARGALYWFIIIIIGLSIYIGAYGNRLTAIKHLEIGWEFDESDELSVKFAKTQWGLK